MSSPKQTTPKAKKRTEGWASFLGLRKDLVSSRKHSRKETEKRQEINI
jgi:hypothetical protein